MSAHFYLWCQATDEAVEVLVMFGSNTYPCIGANALSAFLLYHFIVASGAELKIVELDNYPELKERNICASLKELEEEIESVGDFDGYVKPILLWKESNYLEFIGRKPGLALNLKKYEQSMGVWLKNGDGILIQENT